MKEVYKDVKISLTYLNFVATKIEMKIKNNFPLLWNPSVVGGVYTRKLAPARVSYWDDFFISYHVYMMTVSFHFSLVEGTLHVYKIHVWFKSQTLSFVM